MKISRAKLAAAFAAMALALTACGSANQTGEPAGADSISVTHSQGTTQLNKIPERIVTLDFGALDTINALGLGDKVVALPKTNIPKPLEQFKDDKYADAGTLQEPNIEALAKLKPDVVIVGFRSASKYPELSKHFKTIDVTYKYDKTFAEGVAYSSKIIGTAVGKTKEVDAKLADLDKALAAAKTKAASAGTGMILMTTGGKVTMHGGQSRFGMVHQDLGIKAAVPEVQEAPHGDPVSFEAIQKANPGIMFVVDRDAAVGQESKAAKVILDNPLVASTDAWKNNKVVYLDGQRWYIIIHGLDNATAMVNEVTAGI